MQMKLGATQTEPYLALCLIHFLSSLLSLFFSNWDFSPEKLSPFPSLHQDKLNKADRHKSRTPHNHQWMDGRMNKVTFRVPCTRLKRLWMYVFLPFRTSFRDIYGIYHQEIRISGINTSFCFLGDIHAAKAKPRFAYAAWISPQSRTRNSISRYVGSSVWRSFAPSVVDCEAHATCGDWPCCITFQPMQLVNIQKVNSSEYQSSKMRKLYPKNFCYAEALQNRHLWSLLFRALWDRF